MKDPPSNRSEVNIYHPARPAFARYEVANAEIVSHVVGQYTDIDGNAGNRLFEALEKYLLASAIVVDPEGRNCRLPFRINVE